MREAFLITTTCRREEEKRKKEMRKGLGDRREELSKSWRRAGAEAGGDAEAAVAVPPSPLNPRRRQGGCKVKAGTLSLSLRATQSQASEMQEEVAAQ